MTSRTSRRSAAGAHERDPDVVDPVPQAELRDPRGPSRSGWAVGARCGAGSRPCDPGPSPPVATRHSTFSPRTSSTSSAIRPSSIRTLSPALTSLSEPAVGDAGPLGRADHALRRQHERVAAPQHHAAARREGPQADLRPLEILEDRDGLADPRLDGPDALDCLQVLGMGAVGEVQTGDVHPGPRHLLDDPLGDGRGPDRADDLRETLLGHGSGRSRGAHVRRRPCPGCRSCHRSTRSASRSRRRSP